MNGPTATLCESQDSSESKLNLEIVSVRDSAAATFADHGRARCYRHRTAALMANRSDSWCFYVVFDAQK